MTRRFARLPSPAMIVAVVALVIALTGTAFAAALVSGDQLIKKGSLSGNRLRKHTITGTQVNLSKLGKVPSAASADSATSSTNARHAGSADSATNAGHAGSADSATNAGHASTADSATNATTASNASKLGGQAPSFYAPATLPSGQTETGIYGIIGNGNSRQADAVNFRVPLGSSLPTGSATFIAFGGATTANCPGVGQAARGQLCVYEHFGSNDTLGGIFNPATGSGPSANADGFVIYVNAGAGLFNSYGTWAVTAP
jgi:hypothetical protein